MDGGDEWQRPVRFGCAVARVPGARTDSHNPEP